MSANRDILDAFIAASMRKDYEAFLDLMTDDIEYSWSMSARPVNGNTVMRKFLKNYTNALDQLEWKLNNVIEQGDLMMVEGVEKVFDRNRQTLDSLAYKAFGQWYAYYPDSTSTAMDKANVRDGHYFA